MIPLINGICNFEGESTGQISPKEAGHYFKPTRFSDDRPKPFNMKPIQPFPLKLFTFLVAVICNSGLYAQQVNPQILSTAGNRYQSTAMVIDWTLGELAIATIQGPTSIITQGFHQPKYLFTPINELSKDIGTITVYPNPVTDIIQIKMTFEKSREVFARLTDLNGKQIWNNKFIGQDLLESLSFQGLPNGSYLLIFTTDKEKYSQTFKIQKLN